MKKKPSDLFVICILGTLSVISPFAIDMYLPAFPKVAKQFGVPTTVISLTLSSYFIGLAVGQIFYGPLLDRFGRKRPLLFGLGLFVLSSIGCALSTNISMLVGFRLLQALGACASGVASLAMVRDFFPVKESAKILSMLFLFIAVSPLAAPSVGGFVIEKFGWQSVFLIQMCIVIAIFAVIYFVLPEAHKPDKSISLKPKPIIREYYSIFKQPRFATYALSGAFSFAGLFTFVAGSPIIFMDGFHLSTKAYSFVFSILALGFVCSSQCNVLLLRKFTSMQLYSVFLTLEVIVNLTFVACVWLGLLDLYGTVVLFFISLACVGITYPNAAAMAMAPFTKNAGSAAALLNFLQLGVGSVISVGISLVTAHGSLPIITIFAVTSSLGLVVLMIGYKAAQAAPVRE